jgi:hypothetical protein
MSGNPVPASPTTPDALPLCGLETPLTLSNGFTMCSGTPGDGVTQGPVPNSNPAHAQLMITYYNLANNYKNPQGMDQTDLYTDPCITQGNPDPKLGKPTSEWNTVGYVDAQGCCSTERNWTLANLKPASTNNSRATALVPFTTASALGKNNADNLKNGIPDALGALTKIWGFNGPHWVHGGVHADNCGLWYAPKTKFTIKYNGETWTQDYLLWSRQTGDDYQVNEDPFGIVCPAPIGNFSTIVKLDPYDTKKICTFCPSQGADLGGVFSNPNASTKCPDPFYQVCDRLTALNQSYMLANGYMSTTSPLPQVYNGGENKLPEKNGYQNPKGRVGGIFASNQMYGPGKFTLLANLPPTAPKTKNSPLAQKGFPKVDPATGKYPSNAKGAVPGGRGYVFAMWTFSYTEAYGSTPGYDPIPDPKKFIPENGFPSKTGAAGDAAHPQPTSYAFGNPCTDGNSEDHQTDCNLPKGASASSIQYTEAVFMEGETPGAYTTAGKIFPNIPGLVQGDPDDGSWATHNHEIDIEIPANSTEFQALDSFDKIGMNTANFNTWMTDDNSYNLGALALYQQAQAVAPPGKFFCAVAPEDDQDTYHEYTFVWYVDPATAAVQSNSTEPFEDNSYVAFYLDGVEVYRCKRFVPRRSGRVLIGLWPAWWGSIYQPMDFNQVYCKMARMEFVPQSDYTNTLFEGGALVTNGTQMYDQFVPTTGAEIACDMGVIANRLPVNIDGILAPCRPSQGLKTWEVVLIAIAVALVIGGLTCLLTYRIMKKKAAAAALQSTATTAAASST